MFLTRVPPLYADAALSLNSAVCPGLPTEVELALERADNSSTAASPLSADTRLSQLACQHFNLIKTSTDGGVAGRGFQLTTFPHGPIFRGTAISAVVIVMKY